MATVDHEGSHLRPGQFYGQVAQRRRCPGLVLSEVRHAGARKLPAHLHELAFFCLLLEGVYAEQCGSRRITYRPYTIVFHPPGLSHRDEITAGGARFFTLEVGQCWLERVREHVASLPTAPELCGEETSWLAVRLYGEFRRWDDCSPLTVEALLFELVAGTARRQPVEKRLPPSWLAHVEEKLRAEFAEDLTLAAVAAEVGVHPVHVSRTFRRYFRESPGEFLRRLRVCFACQQLAVPEARLAEVALAAGFADQSHFTRAFKRVTGTTPGSFRAALLQASGKRPAPG
jgi:AraC family transcriptional regulator